MLPNVGLSRPPSHHSTKGFEVSTFLERSENKTKKFWKTHFALLKATAQPPRVSPVLLPQGVHCRSAYVVQEQSLTGGLPPSARGDRPSGPQGSPWGTIHVLDKRLTGRLEDTLKGVSAHRRLTLGVKFQAASFFRLYPGLRLCLQALELTG